MSKRRRVDPNRAPGVGRARWNNKKCPVKSLIEDAVPALVPPQHLQPIRALIYETEEGAAARVFTDELTCRQGEPVERTPLMRGRALAALCASGSNAEFPGSTTPQRHFSGAHVPA